MNPSTLHIEILDSKFLLNFSGELSLYTISTLQKQMNTLNVLGKKNLEIHLQNVSSLDTAAAIFINNIENKYKEKGSEVVIFSNNQDIEDTLSLVK